MVKILTGDCRNVLPALPAGSVNCCVTSPPYWGLRDYGTATWEGGDTGCDHQARETHDPKNPGSSSFGGNDRRRDRNVCHTCGARRIDSQLGLESTPAEHVANLVAVFREVRRVLRDDGTLWLNLGDSYANDGKWGGSTGGKHVADLHGKTGIGRQKVMTGLKPKDLRGIPWRVAFALQADGWYLRQDIIWAKPNPMPESVTDRCTKAHEYIFLLSKPGTAKFWTHRDRKYSECWRAQHTKPDPDYRWLNRDTDEETAEEPANWQTALTADGETRLWHRFNLWRGCDYYCDMDAIKEPAECGRYRGSGLMVKPGTGRNDTNQTGDYRTKESVKRGEFKGKTESMADTGRNAFRAVTETRNKRSVWTVPTKPYKGAHFATFPPDLILPCILAGCPQGGTVLDPFGGSGTTGEAAEMNGRNSILVALNPQYIPLIESRTEQRGLFCNNNAKEVIQHA